MPLDVSAEEKERVLCVTATGKVAKDDYDRLAPRIDALSKKWGGMVVLLHIREFDGWRKAADWEQTKFALRHFRHVERMAVVGERAWQKGAAEFCKPFTRAEIHLFDPDELQKAREWLIETQRAAH